MVQNIKTDIIYYKTNTDFEMEFNLCGCCQMRLLTDKALDKKTLIANLSRAVARSQIILVVGALFGEDNITSNISCAIGKKVVFADNKTYGITSSEKIEIIEGSTPLVTADGIFGGCIIESGPQTMILLSESKSVRKSIMKNLIHPYIEEVYASEPKSEITQEIEDELEEEILQESVSETEEEVLEVDDSQEAEEVFDAEETPDDETNDSGDSEEVDDQYDDSEGIILDEEEEYEEFYDAPQEEENIGLFTESKKILRKEAELYNEAYGDFELDDVGLVGSDEDEYGEAYYPAPSATKIAVIIIAALILVALAVICFCIFYVPSKNGVAAAEYVREIYDTLFG